MKKEKIETSEEAPDYRTLTKGLNMEGTCNNSYCLANKKNVIMKLGMGKWEDVYKININCPLCGNLTDKPWEPYFYHCRYNTNIHIDHKNKIIDHKGDARDSDVHHWDLKKDYIVTKIEAQVFYLDDDDNRPVEHVKQENDCCIIL
jgi:hypothetical protein